MVARRHVIHTSSVGTAEVVAILKGCGFGLALGLTQVVVESYSHDSISALSNLIENGSWEVYPSLMHAKRLGKSFQDCRWS